MNMTFDEYLQSKKIDAQAFQAAQPERWAAWAAAFAQMHPESFTAQKKFLLNELRRQFRLEVVSSDSLSARA